MKIYHFNKGAGKKVTHFNSNFVMSKILISDSEVHIGAMHLEANGVIGHHQAVVPQLLLIVDGEGKVKGNDDVFVNVKKGAAIFWEKDEWHETKSLHGLTAIVIEGQGLNPSLHMQQLNMEGDE